MAEARQGFRVPPEVPRYFADKGLKPAFSYQDVWGEEHAYAFTVAKAVDLDLLKAFKNSIQTAIDQGQGVETWKKTILPELQRLGWAGPRTVLDPTGRAKPASVDFSAPRRLENMFWSNMRAARAAGQWERAQRTKKALGYFVYQRTVSERPRLDHLGFVGIIRHVDDTIWLYIFPPNGWGCKCSVRQISASEARDLASGDGYSMDEPDLVFETFINGRTGEVSKVPKGVDPAWVGNPGLNRAKTLALNLTLRLDEAGSRAAKQRVESWLASGVHKTLYGLDINAPMPIAVSSHVQAEFGALSPIIIVFNQTMAKKVEKHDRVAVETFELAQEIIDNGEMYDEGRAQSRTIIGRAAGKLWQIVVRKSKQGYLRIVTLHATDERSLATIRRRRDEAETEK